MTPLEFEERVARAMATDCGICRDAGTVLVAVSGGADSVALLSALAAAGYQCAIANCNFRLRGDESDRDSAFVAGLAAGMGIPLHTADFDVERRRQETGESLEMACRSLRYDWFETVRADIGAVAIAVAHHRDDNVETLMLNLTRSTGIAGLSGMRPRSGHVVRPMLGVTRQDIIDYLTAKGLQWGEVPSNAENDFKRNRLRNIILPELERQIPGATAAIAATAANVAEDRALLDSLLADATATLRQGDTIDIRALIDKFGAMSKAVLYKMLAPGGFNRTTTDNITDSAAAGNSGGNYRGAWLDRGILTLATDADNTIHTTAAHTFRVSDGCLTPIKITATIHDISEFAPERDPAVIYLDADSIGTNTILTLRHPATGDRLAPYGMRGTRLISDILNDAKLPTLARRASWLLLAGTTPLWLVGIRASSHHPVTPASHRYIRLSLK